MKARLFAWFLLLCTCIIWGTFFYGIYVIGNERTSYSTLKESLATREEEGRVSSRVRALLRDTLRERSALESFTTVDVVTAAGTIEGAGKIVGVKAAIEGATAAPPVDPNVNVRAVTVVVHATGSYKALKDFVAIMEFLPFASFIESVDVRPDVTRLPNRWESTIHIKIITTSTLGV